MVRNKLLKSPLVINLRLILLQITESGFWCGAVFVLSTFYKPREIAMRNSIFYCGNWLSGALGGAFAGAIIDGKFLEIRQLLFYPVV